MRSQTMFFLFVAAILAIVLIAVGPQTCQSVTLPQPTPTLTNSVNISIVYAPEYKEPMEKTIAEFNQAYREGRNPLTRMALTTNERPIQVAGKDGSSGTVMQGIVNAVIAPNNQNVERPTIYSPSVGHWLVLANYQTGRELFTLDERRPTGLAPVVIAIWESRLQAIQKKHPGQLIGWEELLEVMNDPQGWAAYGISGRNTVYYGHTDPYISSTALSTLIAEFTASSRYHAGLTGRRLTMDDVNNPQVQAGVRELEGMIRHYSSRTTEFKFYIAQGPDYVDFVPLEENDLLYINQGKTEYKPPEKLVALYPKEGTFWHEHPFAIPNADWVTDEQREAAKVFTEYVLSVPVQKRLMEAGFRPANLEVKLDYPFVKELGVDTLQPATVLELPSPDVLAAIQASWQYVKKQADVILLVDTSGSMEGDKLAQAKKALKAFVLDQANSNRVGLMQFNAQAETLVALDDLETNRGIITATVETLRTNDNTALYDSLLAAMNQLTATETSRIKAVVVLSDGLNNRGQASLNNVVMAITKSGEGKEAPILVIPVAYGADADIAALNAIARASKTKVQSGDPKNIGNVLAIISSYF